MTYSVRPPSSSGIDDDGYEKCSEPRSSITEADRVNFNNNVQNGNLNLPQNRQSNNQYGNGLQSPTKLTMGDYIKLKLLQSCTRSNICLIKM